MALNNMGLGFIVTAKDLSKATFEAVQSSLGLTGIKAGEVSKATKEAADIFNQAAASMGLAGAAILGVLGLAANAAHELEQSFKLVSTRANEATLPMAEVRDLALSLSNQFGVAQTAEASALYEAISKGATDTASATAVLTASTQLSVGAHIELKSALDATTQVLRAFHLPMSDAAAVTDQLLTASERGAGSIEELSGALEHLGPTAARANLSSSDLLGAVTALSNAGLKGRAAIGGMRAVLEALVQPSDAAKQQAAALGVTLDSAKIASMGFVPWIQSLGANTHLTAAAMGKLFGSAEASTAAMALMRNGGADLQEALSSVKNSTGAAADAAETMTDQWQRTKTLTSNALAALGKAFTPLLDAVIKPINAGIEAFTKLSPGMQKAIGFGLLFVGTTLLIAGGIAGMTAAIAVFGATVAPVIAAAVALLWPVALVLAGIAAGAYLLKAAWDSNFGGIQTTLTAFWGKVKLVWDGVSQLFSQGGFSGSVRDELNKAGNGGLKDFAITVFLWFNRIKGYFDAFTTALGSAFEAARPIFDTLVEVFTEVTDALGDLFGGPNSPERAAIIFRAFAAAGGVVGDVLAVLVRAVLFLITVALVPLRLIIAGLTGGWDGLKHAALSSFADIIKGALGMAQSLAGIADHIAKAFGKDLGASKLVGDFAKQVDLSVRPGAEAGTAPGMVPGSGSSVAAPTTSIGSDSPAVQEARAAAARLKAGETGAGADSDRAYFQRMLPVLEAIQKNGNQPVVVHLDGEVIATAVKKNADAHSARGFAPRPAAG